MLRDLRLAVRSLRRTPGFTLVALLALALGTGANSAIFSVIDAVLLRPLSFPEPDRLIRIDEQNSGGEMGLAYLNFLDIRAQNRSFRELAGYYRHDVTITGIQPPTRAAGMFVSAEFFHLTGARPILGRVFTPDEDRSSARRVALLTATLWNARFGRDAAILGRSVIVDGASYTVIGVIPQFPEPFRAVGFIAALGCCDRERSMGPRGDHTDLHAIAALNPGVTLAQARAEFDNLYTRLEKLYPASNSGVRAALVPLLDGMIGNVKPALWILFAAVGFVLMIGCVNVANLMLARSNGRRRETAVRQALGATRFALTRHILAESLVISLGGAILGLLGAFWAVDAIRAAAPESVARLDAARLNWMVFAFTLGVSIVAAVACGLVPAFLSSRADLIEAMRSGGRTSTASAGAERSRSFLLVGEVALAMVLLVGAGLMLRTIREIRHIEPGFDSRNLLCVDVLLSRNYTEPKAREFWETALQQIRSIPGVLAASATDSLPMEPSSWNSVFEATNWPTPARAEMPSSMFTPVDARYLETMRMHLARGRWFDSTDGASTPAVVVVNQTMAARLWPGRDAIGQKIKQGWPEDRTRWREVIGVVADSRQSSLDAKPMMQVFLPDSQVVRDGLTLVIRTASDPLRMVPAVERTIRQIDAELPVSDVRTMDQLMAWSYENRNFETGLLEVFAAIALLLAALGIYGVTSYMVSQRTTEIGVRMALGAGRTDVLSIVLRRALGPSVMGLLLGAAGAMAASRAMNSLLYGVSGTDPLTLGAVAAIFLGVAALASVAPAWRAIRVDPIEALRSE